MFYSKQILLLLLLLLINSCKKEENISNEKKCSIQCMYYTNPIHGENYNNGIIKDGLIKGYDGNDILRFQAYISSDETSLIKDNIIWLLEYKQDNRLIYSRTTGTIAKCYITIKWMMYYVFILKYNTKNMFR